MNYNVLYTDHGFNQINNNKGKKVNLIKHIIIRKIYAKHIFTVSETCRPVILFYFSYYYVSVM